MGKLSESDFRKLVSRCRSLPPLKGNYLVHDYIENLMLTVLDTGSVSTKSQKAIDHYRNKSKKDLPGFAAFHNMFSRYPDNAANNKKIAKQLWGNNNGSKARTFRQLFTYFGSRGMISIEGLLRWASKADFERDFKGRVKGIGHVTFNWLLTRLGADTVKPDKTNHDFVEKVLGYSVNDKTLIEVLKRAAQEMGIKACELDWRISEYKDKNFNP